MKTINCLLNAILLGDFGIRYDSIQPVSSLMQATSLYLCLSYYYPYSYVNL
jgi:hypothetical protein